MSSDRRAAAPLWGTFEKVRPHLLAQFRDVPYQAATGLPVAELDLALRDEAARLADAPRVAQKAALFHTVMTRAQIAVDPLDWFACHVQHGGLIWKIRDEWYAAAKATTLREEAGWFDAMYATGTLYSLLDMHHISQGWERMFAGGLDALAADARTRRTQCTDAGRMAFYAAVASSCGSACALAERLAALADEAAHSDAANRDRLARVAAACRRVPAQSPRSLHEALQFIWFMQVLVEIEGEWPMAYGHFDRLLYPYYCADIAAGRLTRDQAKELLKFFWIKIQARTQGQGDSAKNFVLGGQDRDGRDATTEFTRLALEAREELEAPDPKMSVRFFPGSPDSLYEQVARIIRNGHNAFVLMNDEPTVAALVKRGKTVEDARTYLPIGCYEPAIDGKEAACTMNLTVNLAKGIELALHDGLDPLSGTLVGIRTGDPYGFTCFEDAFAAYRRQMEFIIQRGAACISAHELQWPVINPSPMLACGIDDCLATGKDIGQGGAHYNAVGCVGTGLANACDSLMAIDQVVFEERRCSMRQLVDAIDRDFADDEPLRQYLLNRVPKWGNNLERVDRIGRRVADHFCHTVHALRNARGGPYQAALFSLDYRTRLGRNTGALPDGRKARTSLAPGAGAMVGMDKHGVTALIGSATALDYTETPNGSILDLMLHPSALQGAQGLKAFVTLIKTFFARGGQALQCNVVDAATLRKAQTHPEQFATLQIRVTGWSVYFTSMSKQEQDHYIARTTHRV